MVKKKMGNHLHRGTVCRASSRMGDILEDGERDSNNVGAKVMINCEKFKKNAMLS